MNESFTASDARVPAKSGRCGPQRCAGVLNESFRTSEDLNESFKTWGERVTGGGVAWPRDFAGTLRADVMNESFMSPGEVNGSFTPLWGRCSPGKSCARLLLWCRE